MENKPIIRKKKPAKKCVIGLDISTTSIGINVMDYDKKLLHYESLKIQKYKDIWIKLEKFKEKMVEIRAMYRGVDRVFIEAPLFEFQRGKSNIKTIVILQVFNHLCQSTIRDTLKITPKMINVGTARAKIGFSCPKKTPGKNKKIRVCKYVANEFNNFELLYTKANNIRPGILDISDSIAVSWAGLLMLEEKNGE